MAANLSYPNCIHHQHNLAGPNANLTVRIIEEVDLGEYSEPSQVHMVAVNLEILWGAADFFRQSIQQALTENPASRMIDFFTENHQGILTWLKLLHGHMQDPALYSNLTVIDVWEVMFVSIMFGYSAGGHLGKAWFETWYHSKHGKSGKARFTFKDHQMLLIPLKYFDCAPGMAFTSKYLALHGVGAIEVKRPEKIRFTRIALDNTTINQLHMARGRLRLLLQRELYRPIEQLLLTATTCGCEARILFEYQRALFSTGMWPLETSWLSKSISKISAALETSRELQHGRPQGCGKTNCCTFNFVDVVKHAVKQAREGFDGVCLDCYHDSKPQENRNGSDHIYWNRGLPSNPWSLRCRIPHGRASWFYSFSGMQATMLEWQELARSQGQDTDDGAYPMDHFL